MIWLALAALALVSVALQRAIRRRGMNLRPVSAQWLREAAYPKDGR